MKRTAENQQIVDRLIQVFASSEKDSVIPYGTLSELCGCDVRDRGRTYIYAAQKELQRAYRRTVSCVRGVGYLVPQAKDHEYLAKQQHQHAIAKMTRGVKVIDAADETELTAAERRRKDQISYALTRVVQNQCQLAKELRRQEEIINMHQGEITYHDDEIESLKDRIAALENSRDQ